jgi:hypothetical protein
MNLIKSCSSQLAMGAISAGAMMSGLFAPNPASAVTITYENPNIYSASSAIGATHQIDFESVPLGITTNYSDSFVDNASGRNYTAIYDLLQVNNYGGNSQTAGAGYTRQFATNIGNVQTTNLTFTDATTGNNAAGVKYFGLFYSSLDNFNQLTFYDGSNILAEFTFSDIPKLLHYDSAFVGGPYNQYGAFFNFYADAGEQITKIQFKQLGGGGLESDNHTFRVPDALSVAGNEVDLAGLNVTTGTLKTTQIPEPGDVFGTLVGGMLALGLKRKLSKQQPTTTD